jgi:hypothetical protein
MARNRTEQHLTKRQEKALLRAATAAVRTGFPNPERYGCPEAKVIQNMADRRVSLPETRELVDHIATCSPCFAAYNRYRRQYRARRVAVPIVVIVCLLALALVWSYRSPRTSPRHRVERPAASVLMATIDYRAASPTRSTEPQRSPETTPHVQKVLLNLTILLPFGSEDGKYSIALLDPTNEPVAQADGTARWNGTAEVLTAEIDLRQLAPGEYTLALRSGGASYRKYRLILEEPK